MQRPTQDEQFQNDVEALFRRYVYALADNAMTVQTAKESAALKVIRMAGYGFRDLKELLLHRTLLHPDCRRVLMSFTENDVERIALSQNHIGSKELYFYLERVDPWTRSKLLAMDGLALEDGQPFFERGVYYRNLKYPDTGSIESDDFNWTSPHYRQVESDRMTHVQAVRRLYNDIPTVLEQPARVVYKVMRMVFQHVGVSIPEIKMAADEKTETLENDLVPGLCTQYENRVDEPTRKRMAATIQLDQHSEYGKPITFVLND